MTCGAVFRCRKYVRYLHSSVYRFNEINRTFYIHSTATLLFRYQ